MGGAMVGNIINYKALRLVEKLTPDMYCPKCHWIKEKCKCKQDKEKP